MNFYTIAIGGNYLIEANRLKKSIPTLNIFDINHPLYVELDKSQIENALYHKSNFANYIDDSVKGPIFFMDADLYSDIENPMSFWEISDDVDVAYVPYKGQWFFPDEERIKATKKLGSKINSGFIYFKNIEIAKTICTEWYKIMQRRLPLNVYEYDEYSLMIALDNLDFKFQNLDPRWNDWGENTEGQPMLEDAIFKQMHIK